MNSIKKPNKRIKLIAGCGMLVAVSVVLQYIEISLPFMPAFLKLDFSDIPALIGAFAYSPVCGVVISLLKNVIHLPVSQSFFVGELSNFILSSVFSFTASAIYKKNKTKRNALVAGCISAVITAILAFPLNAYIVYPLYYALLLPKEALLGLYRELIPEIDSVNVAILIFNVPFTFVKELLCTVLTLFIYKPFSRLFK